MALGLAVPDDFELPTREQIESLLNTWTERQRTENRDRTSAIVNAVDLEQLLVTLILDIMIDDQESENTLKQTLNSFHAKIQLAYCLGLVSLDEYTDLHIIRRVRNYFAHSPSGSTFEDQKVAALCDNLKIPQHRSELFDDLSLSEKFNSTVFVLSQNIWDRRSLAKKRKGCIPDEIDSEQWVEFFG